MSHKMMKDFPCNRPCGSMRKDTDHYGEHLLTRMMLTG